MKCEQASALYSVGVLLVPFAFDLCFLQCRSLCLFIVVAMYGVHTSLRFVQVLLTFRI